MRIRKHFLLNFDRSFSEKTWNQVVWNIAIFILSFIVVWLGILIFGNNNANKSWKVIVDMISPVPLYHNVYDTSLSRDSNYILLFAYLIGVIIFSGMLIATCANILRVRSENFKQGKVFYKFSDHVLILGYNSMVISLVKQICAKEEYNDCDIVIQTQYEVHKLREIIHTFLDRNEEQRVVIIHSKQDSKEDLQRLKVANAREIYIIGNEEDEEHDALNLNSLKIINIICKGRKPKLPCYTNLKYQSTFALFQANKDEAILENIDFLPFNFYELWARRVFVDCKNMKINLDGEDINYLPLDYRDKENNIFKCPEKQVHLVIFGMTEMGNALAIEAAYIAHYPNFITNNVKTKITFIDEYADNEMDYFVGRYRELFKHCHYSYKGVIDQSFSDKIENKLEDDYLDIEFEFIKANVANAIVLNLIEEWSNDNKQLLTIVSCFKESPKNIATGFYLPRIVYDNNIPILIQQKSTGDIAHLLKDSKFSNVKPFGMTDEGYNLNSREELWAKKVNYVYCTEEDKINLLDTDVIQNDWNNLNVVNKWSNVYNALSIPTKLRSIGLFYNEDYSSLRQLTDKENNLLAEVEHNRWNMEKLLIGFRPANVIEKEEIEEDINKKIKKKMDYESTHEDKYKDKNTKKNFYKNRFIHYDIRPYKDLRVDENNLNINRYDKILTRYIVDIIKAYRM